VVSHVGSHKGQGFEQGLERVVRSVAEAEELALTTLARVETKWVESALPEVKAQLAEGPRARPAHALEGGTCAQPAHQHGDGGPPWRLPPLLLETSAGSKNTLGRNVEELALLLGAVSYEQTGVCLDTAHVYAGGIPVHTEEGLEELVTEFARHIGWERLGLVHLNDCRTAFGSLHDQHSNIGDGNLGEEGLGRVVRHPRLRRVPFILEVPGLEDQGPDLENVRRARRLREGFPLEPTAPAARG
jgi:endonuclease IV